MSDLRLARENGDTFLIWSVAQSQHRVRCAVGKGGVAVKLREGDGVTPVGVWPLRRVLYRADRVAMPQTKLPVASIAQDDGWCDAPSDPNYNRPVKLPYAASHERLWREDALYDVIVIVGYNDDPVVAGKGSAIFLHLAREDFPPTEGCVALARADLLRALEAARPGDSIHIG